MKVALLLIALYFISGEAAFQFDASKNASLANGDEFKFRATTYGKWSLLFWSGAWFGTFGADIVPNQLDVDAIWASCYVGTSNYPNSWIAHFDATAKYNITPNTNFNFVQADVTASAGFMGTGYLRLDELDTTGTVVQTLSFKDLIWTEDSTSGASGAQNNLYWVTYKGSKILNPINVKLTFATSSVYGYLSSDWLEAFISPKSIESFVYIDGWSYKNNANTLRLSTVVATAKAQISADGSLSINSGDTQVSFAITKKALVKGSVTDQVKVSGFTEVDLAATIENADFTAQLNAKYGANAKAYLVYTTFPAGANQILLDPTMSVGSQPQFNSASSFSYAFGLFALLALIFIGL